MSTAPSFPTSRIRLTAAPPRLQTGAGRTNAAQASRDQTNRRPNWPRGTPRPAVAGEHVRELGQHGLEILGRLWRRFGQGVPDVARRDLRQHGKPLGVLHEAGDPLDHRMAVPAELVRRHVAVRLIGWGIQGQPPYGGDCSVEAA